MKRWIGMGCLLLLVALLVGCSPRTESSNYYYSPGWTRDGKIIFIGTTQSVEKDILGSQLGSSYADYVKTIYPTGTDESQVLFDVTGDLPYSMSCSPSRDYVAYMGDLRTGLFGKIVIRNIASGQHTGLEVAEIHFSPGIKSFDWSNDGEKLVYCTTSEVRIRDWDDLTGATDALITAETGCTFVSWQNGGRIAFVHTSGTNEILSIINPDGSGRQNQAANRSVDLPQISGANTSEVYGVVADAYKKVNVDTDVITDVVALGFEGELPRLYSDGKQLVYSKTGYTTGIFLIEDVTAATITETQVK